MLHDTCSMHTSMSSDVLHVNLQCIREHPFCLHVLIAYSSAHPDCTMQS